MKHSFTGERGCDPAGTYRRCIYCGLWDDEADIPCTPRSKRGQELVQTGWRSDGQIADKGRKI